MMHRPPWLRRPGTPPPIVGVPPLIVALLATLAFGVGPISAEAQLPAGLGAETFDAAWSLVRDSHFDPEMRGLDWEAVRVELRPRAAAASGPEDLRTVLAEMLGRLGDSHFAVIPEASAEVFESATSASSASASEGGGDSEPGILLRWIDHQLVVAGIREGSPADREGVGTGWIVLAIAGTPVDSLVAQVRAGAPMGQEERHLALWVPMTARARLTGLEGSRVQLQLRDALDEELVLELEREPPAGVAVTFGDLPLARLQVDHRVVTFEDGRRIGVLRLSAWFPPALALVSAAMEELRELDGIVLDLRGNPGGLAAMAMGIGGHFVGDAASLGTLTTRDAVLRFPINPQRVAADGRRVEPFEGPLALVVDPLTASTSEVFAGGMQGLDRARVFGEPTAGQALPALVSGLPNGDRLLHAIADFTGPNGSRLEGRGVIPDVAAPPTRAALLAGRDPALDAAMDWLRSRDVGPGPPSPLLEIPH